MRFPGLEQSEEICIPSLCSSTPLPQTVTRPQCVTPCPSRTGLAVTAMPQHEMMNLRIFSICVKIRKYVAFSLRKSYAFRKDA